MNKVLLTILIFGFTSTSIIAQKLTLSDIENEDGELVQCYKNNNGDVHCTVYYIGSIADNYSGGLRRIKKENKIGFIDKKGSIKIDPQFGKAEKFCKKMCAVKSLGKELDLSATDGSAEISWEEGLWGIIDKKGKIVKPFDYERKWNEEHKCYEYYNKKEQFLFTTKGKIKHL